MCQAVFIQQVNITQPIKLPGARRRSSPHKTPTRCRPLLPAANKCNHQWRCCIVFTISTHRLTHVTFRAFVVLQKFRLCLSDLRLDSFVTQTLQYLEDYLNHRLIDDFQAKTLALYVRYFDPADVDRIDFIKEFKMIRHSTMFFRVEFIVHCVTNKFTRPNVKYLFVKICW